MRILGRKNGNRYLRSNRRLKPVFGKTGQNDNPLESNSAPAGADWIAKRKNAAPGPVSARRIAEWKSSKIEHPDPIWHILKFGAATAAAASKKHFYVLIETGELICKGHTHTVALP